MQIAITQIVIVVKYLICFPLRTNMSCWMIHANTKTKHTQIEREKKLKKQTKEWKERKWTTKCKKKTHSGDKNEEEKTEESHENSLYVTKM